MIENTVILEGHPIEVVRWDGEGTGLPILLFHEGLGSVRLWKDFPKRLSRTTGREVIAWSRHGHGFSGGVEIPHEPDYMHREADLLPALHAAIGIERAHWLGHSDGGSIALLGAAAYPALAASLILEAPHVLVEDLTANSIATVAEGFAASDMGKRMERYHAAPVPMFERWARIWLLPAFREWNIERDVAGIQVPALLIQGRNDQYGTMEQLDRIARLVPETARVELDTCGHAPHHERQESVLNAVKIFLEGKD